MSSSSAAANHDELIAQLSSLTGLPPSEAEQYLTAANGDLQTAASLFFDGDAGSIENDEPEDLHGMSGNNPEGSGDDRATPPVPQPGGGRTLGGAYVPPTASSSSSAAQGQQRSQPQRGLRTLKDIQQAGGAGHGHGHGHGHDEDDDEDEGDEQDFFTGGEKSGLAVQNPGQGSSSRDHINSILRRARQNAQRPGGDDEQRPQSHFRGAGVTLGGDDAESRIIPDPNAAVPPPAPRTHRQLHLWRDGFSVDDGPLYRYDDPANARTLEMINTGHAPLHILNVERGQEVDVEVHPHKDEDYKQPKKKYVPFSGSGQRLGSPTPGVTSTPPPPAPAATSSTTGSAQPAVNIDESVPTITLQIRLGDGTRLQSRFNTTHTVGDVYQFVTASSPASRERAFALMTTFPSKELADKAQVLGDMGEFKRGGVVVQKWL